MVMATPKRDRGPRDRVLGWMVDRDVEMAVRRAVVRRGRHCGNSISAVVGNLIDRRKLRELLADDAAIRTGSAN